MKIKQLCGFLSVFLGVSIFNLNSSLSDVSNSSEGSESRPGSRYEIEARAIGMDEISADAATQAILNLATVRDRLDDVSFRVIASELNVLGAQSSRRYAIQVYDYTNDELITIDGPMEEIAAGQITTDDASSGDQFLAQPDPTFEEFLDAIALLSQHPDLGSAVASNKLKPYLAMPTLLERTENTGRRVFPVGLRSNDPDRPHEIVAVDLARKNVERFERRSPPGSIATAHVCGTDSAGQGITRRGTPGSAQINIRRDSETLWSMTVTRASASSGTWGSGVELKDVRYKGELVLHRAHVPILNVDYIDNVCGPFRDPVNHENAYVSTGTQITSGIIQASEMPSTIFDTKDDRGNYWGVSVFEQEDEIVIMSELSAGWYRYVSEFRFYPDGTIKPLFKFDAVHNSCTCETHDHHAYWRFDFDVQGRSPNSVDVLDSSGWRPVMSEERHLRNEGITAWRVFNTATNRGYEITPGPYDQPTTDFGVGDAWVLRYNRNEIDDSAFGRSAIAKLDRFLTGESVRDTDIVFWYAGHITHAEDGAETPHIAGPTIRPWTAEPR